MKIYILRDGLDCTALDYPAFVSKARAELCADIARAMIEEYEVFEESE